MTYETSTGTHTIVARLQGYNDSPPITMEVTEDGDNSRQLLLLPKTTDPLDQLPGPTNEQPIIDSPVDGAVENP